MRRYQLSLFCCLTLSSCAYYGNIHGNSHSLNTVELATPHVYHSSIAATSANWWANFKDPQLNQLISVAIADSPTMQIAEARVRRAEQITGVARSTLWPSIDFSGYVQRQRFSKYGLIPPPFNGRTFNIATLGLNFNYEFDFWGKNRQRVQARVNEQAAAQAEAASAQLVLSAAVANTYFQLLGNIEQVKIANSNWKLNQQLLTITTARNKRGIESAIPVITLKVNAQAAKQVLEQYRQAELLSRHQLAALLGKNPFTTSIITRHFTYHAYHVTLPSSLPAHLLAQRPDIYAAKFRAEAAANEINIAKARFFPDINLMGLFSYQSALGFNHLFERTSQDNAVTAAVDLPIFDAGARRADLGVKYAEYDTAVNEYNQTILTALREVADQLSRLQTIGSQLTAEHAAENATERNYKLYRARYNHGIADYAEVLERKQLLLQQQSTRLTLQTRHLQAAVGMLQALGGNDFIGQG